MCVQKTDQNGKGMSPTQRRLLGNEMYRLGVALKNGRWSDRELARLVERVKPRLDELHADLKAPCDLSEVSGHPRTPWDRVTADIEKSIAKITGLPVESQKPQGISALFAGRQFGLECSLPIGDRA